MPEPDIRQHAEQFILKCFQLGHLRRAGGRSESECLLALARARLPDEQHLPPESAGKAGHLRDKLLPVLGAGWNGNILKGVIDM